MCGNSETSTILGDKSTLSEIAEISARTNGGATRPMLGTGGIKITVGCVARTGMVSRKRMRGGKRKRDEETFSSGGQSQVH